MNNIRSLMIFVLLVFGGGLAIGVLTAPPGDWYQDIQKPFFNPPNWIFGPVWSVLYLIIAFVGWLIWHLNDRSILWKLWLGQMGLNFIWSPVFFEFQMPSLALVVIVGLLITIILFIHFAQKSSALSAFLFLPYLAWVGGFATLLNAAIVYLN